MATQYAASAVPELGAAEVAALAAAAREAQAGWEEAGFGARGEVLARLRKWLLRNSERVIETIVSETGKAYEDAQLLDLGYTLSALSFWERRAEGYLHERRRWSRSPLLPGRRVVTRWVPRGLVGVIGPWNYPLLNSFGDAIPALMAGNSVILKPSELTPLTSLLLAEGLARVRTAGGRLRRRDRRSRHGRGGRGRRRLRDVHRLDGDRPGASRCARPRR